LEKEESQSGGWIRKKGVTSDTEMLWNS